MPDAVANELLAHPDPAVKDLIQAAKREHCIRAGRTTACLEPALLLLGPSLQLLPKKLVKSAKIHLHYHANWSLMAFESNRAISLSPW